MFFIFCCPINHVRPICLTLHIFGLFPQAHLLLFQQRIAQSDLWRKKIKSQIYFHFLCVAIDFLITCLSLKDRFSLPLAFCFNIMKFFFLLFSRLVVLALGFWRLGFLDGFSRSARPSYIDKKIVFDWHSQQMVKSSHTHLSWAYTHSPIFI